MNYSPNLKEIDRYCYEAEAALATFDEQYDETASGHYLLLKAIAYALLMIGETQTPRETT